MGWYKKWYPIFMPQNTSYSNLYSRIASYTSVDNVSNIVPAYNNIYLECYLILPSLATYHCSSTICENLQLPYSTKFDEANFNGYWLFKYLTEIILTDGHCLSPYTYKRCIVFKQFDGLNFDGLAGKRQKRQNFPCQNFALYGR